MVNRDSELMTTVVRDDDEATRLRQQRRAGVEGEAR